MAEAPSAAQALDSLTLRQREILDLFAEGVTSKKAQAEKLGLSAHTVKFHQRHLREKLGVHSAAELTHIADQRKYAGNSIRNNGEPLVD